MYHREQDKWSSHTAISWTLPAAPRSSNAASALGDTAARDTYISRAKQEHHLLIEIALDEGDIDNALQLLKGIARQDRQGYIYRDPSAYYAPNNIALKVAAAAEETQPREAIELYRQHAERLIAERGRQNYETASKYLAQMHTLYTKLGAHEEWTSYITALRERNRALRALKEELARAGL